MKSLSLFRVLPLFLLTIFLVSCGDRPKVVENLKVDTYTQDTDLYLGFNAILNFGAMSLPSATIPIYHPKGNGLIGKLSMNPIAGGKNSMGLDVNLSTITGLGSASATLPNGNRLPLIDANETVVIGVGPNGKIKIYLSLVDGAQALGVAIPIGAFDAIGSRVGATSLFPVFNVSGVLGSAGMYTSKTSGQNGFGIFLDVHSIISKIPPKSANGFVSKRSTLRSGRRASLNYSSITPSRSKEKKINKMIYRLNKKKTRLD
jgi:hypothetical protein